MKKISLILLIISSSIQLHAYKIGLYSLHYLAQLFLQNAESSRIIEQDALNEEQKQCFFQKLILLRHTVGPNFTSCDLGQAIVFLKEVKIRAEHQDRFITNAAYAFYKYICYHRHLSFSKNNFAQNFYEKNTVASIAEDLLFQECILKKYGAQFEDQAYIRHFYQQDNTGEENCASSPGDIDQFAVNKDRALGFINDNPLFRNIIRYLFENMHNALIIDLKQTIYVDCTQCTNTSRMCVLL